MGLDQVYVDRLTKLRDTLLTVPKERFDICDWGRRDDAFPLENLSDETRKEPFLGCGFAGCVYGHFPTAFWGEGWRWNKTGTVIDPQGYATREGIIQMSKWLGLTWEQVEYLALPEAYETYMKASPQEAAAHIDAILSANAAGHSLPVYDDSDDGWDDDDDEDEEGDLFEGEDE